MIFVLSSNRIIIARIVLNEDERHVCYEIVIERNAYIVLPRYADKIVRVSRDDPPVTPIIPHLLERNLDSNVFYWQTIKPRLYIYKLEFSQADRTPSCVHNNAIWRFSTYTRELR